MYDPDPDPDSDSPNFSPNPDPNLSPKNPTPQKLHRVLKQVVLLVQTLVGILKPPAGAGRGGRGVVWNYPPSEDAHDFESVGLVEIQTQT